MARLIQNVEAECEQKAAATDLATDAEAKLTKDKADKLSAADVLMREARQCLDLWRSPDGKAYMTLPNGLNHGIGSTAGKAYLGHLVYTKTGKGLATNAMDQAVSTLEAIALHDKASATNTTYLRYAKMGGKLYIDLGGESSEAVEIDATGWKIIGKPPVKFIRSANMKPLSKPERCGTIDLLRPFVNADDDNFCLFVGSILDAMKGFGPYLVTAVTGEHGSAKSTLLRLMRRIVDPMLKAELAGCPRNEQDLVCHCNGSHFVAFDNIKKLPQWLSDALCRVSTGQGMVGRKLYTDDEQHVFGVCNPLALNGIDDFTEAADLASRSAPIVLDVIPPEARKEEKEIWAAFDEVLPRILGALFDAIAHGLRTVDSVHLPVKPRMADSARWIAATFPSFGWKYEDWHDAFTEAQSATGDLLLSGSLPAKVLTEWFRQFKGDTWKGQPKQLYENLHSQCEGTYPDKLKFFPANPQTLSNALRSMAPALRREGIDVGSTKRGKVSGVTKRIMTISRVPQGERAVNDGGEKVNAPGPDKGDSVEKQEGTVNAQASGERTVNDVSQKTVHPQNPLNRRETTQEEGVVNAVNDLFYKLETKSKKSDKSDNTSLGRNAENDRSLRSPVHLCSSSTLREATAGDIPLDVACKIAMPIDGSCRKAYFRPLLQAEKNAIRSPYSSHLGYPPMEYPEGIEPGSWSVYISREPGVKLR
jgi:hypothetical protein